MKPVTIQMLRAPLFDRDKNWTSGSTSAELAESRPLHITGAESQPHERAPNRRCLASLKT
jgi:hypothetical protein